MNRLKQWIVNITKNYKYEIVLSNTSKKWIVNITKNREFEKCSKLF